MPLYHYTALNRQGAQKTGTIDAPSPDGAKELLRSQGLMPTLIKESLAAQTGSSFMQIFERKVDKKAIILFTKQFGVLLRSGVPLLEALELLTEQFEGQFRRILITIKDNVKAGESLGSELSHYPRVFANVYVQLVKAGEASGKLDTILERLTEYLEKSEATMNKINKALRTPIMQLSFSLLILSALLVFVVPKMTDMFSKMGKELPGPTQLLISISDFMVNHFFILIGGVVSIFLLLSYIKSTPKGAYRLDALLLRIPVTGYFSRTKAIVQFSKTLGMLLESGVNLAEALDIVTNIVENKVLTQQLSNARDQIIKEGKIAQYLKATGMFPKIASYMINTGEQSGKLAEMLLTVGNDYEQELSDLTDGLTASISPVMTMVMGILIGFIVIALFMPIMSMNDMAGI